MKFLNGLWEYLKNWKNLLANTIIGVGIQLVAFAIPVKPFYRVILLAAVVGFNLIRMGHSKRFLNRDRKKGANVAKHFADYTNHPGLILSGSFINLQMINQHQVVLRFR